MKPLRLVFFNRLYETFILENLCQYTLLSEYKGIIVGVYKINEWYKSPDNVIFVIQLNIDYNWGKMANIYIYF